MQALPESYAALIATDALRSWQPSVDVFADCQQQQAPLSVATNRPTSSSTHGRPSEEPSRPAKRHYRRGQQGEQLIESAQHPAAAGTPGTAAAGAAAAAAGPSKQQKKTRGRGKAASRSRARGRSKKATTAAPQTAAPAAASSTPGLEAAPVPAAVKSSGRRRLLLPADSDDESHSRDPAAQQLQCWPQQQQQKLVCEQRLAERIRASPAAGVAAATGPVPAGSRHCQQQQQQQQQPQELQQGGAAQCSASPVAPAQAQDDRHTPTAMPAGSQQHCANLQGVTPGMDTGALSAGGGWRLGKGAACRSHSPAVRQQQQQQPEALLMSEPQCMPHSQHPPDASAAAGPVGDAAAAEAVAAAGAGPCSAAGSEGHKQDAVPTLTDAVTASQAAVQGMESALLLQQQQPMKPVPYVDFMPATQTQDTWLGSGPSAAVADCDRVAAAAAAAGATASLAPVVSVDYILATELPAVPGSPVPYVDFIPATEDTEGAATQPGGMCASQAAAAAAAAAGLCSLGSAGSNAAAAAAAPGGMQQHAWPMCGFSQKQGCHPRPEQQQQQQQQHQLQHMAAGVRLPSQQVAQHQMPPPAAAAAAAVGRSCRVPEMGSMLVDPDATQPQPHALRPPQPRQHAACLDSTEQQPHAYKGCAQQHQQQKTSACLDSTQPQPHAVNIQWQQQQGRRFALLDETQPQPHALQAWQQRQQEAAGITSRHGTAPGQDPQQQRQQQQQHGRWGQTVQQLQPVLCVAVPVGEAEAVIVDAAAGAAAHSWPDTVTQAGAAAAGAELAAAASISQTGKVQLDGNPAAAAAAAAAGALRGVTPFTQSPAAVADSGAAAVGLDMHTLTVQSPVCCDLTGTELEASPAAVVDWHVGDRLAGVDDEQPVGVPQSQQQQQQQQQQGRARVPCQEVAVAAAATADAATHPAAAAPVGSKHLTGGTSIGRATVDRAAAGASSVAAAAAAGGAGSGWMSARGACRRQWSSSRHGEGSVVGLWRKAGLLQQDGQH